MPKNSVTIKITNQDGNAINGLKISLMGTSFYENEFTDIENITILSVTLGSYTISFDEIPEGYICLTVIDNFTLKENGKVKLEYECIKEN